MMDAFVQALTLTGTILTITLSLTPLAIFTTLTLQQDN